MASFHERIQLAREGYACARADPAIDLRAMQDWDSADRWGAAVGSLMESCAPRGGCFDSELMARAAALLLYGVKRFDEREFAQAAQWAQGGLILAARRVGCVEGDAMSRWVDEVSRSGVRADNGAAGFSSRDKLNLMNLISKRVLGRPQEPAVDVSADDAAEAMEAFKADLEGRLIAEGLPSGVASERARSL